MRFPVLLQLDQQDELMVAATAEQLQQLLRLHAAVLVEDDRLIDSDGRCYRCDSQTATSSISLSELTALVQAHFFALSQSCTLKIQAPSAADLIHLVLQQGD